MFRRKTYLWKLVAPSTLVSLCVNEQVLEAVLVEQNRYRQFELQNLIEISRDHA